MVIDDDRKTPKNEQILANIYCQQTQKSGFKHNRGVISMPSGEIDNPHKLASPFEFFIVCQKGGAHHLDGDYTLFLAKLLRGMDVVDEIAAQETDGWGMARYGMYTSKSVEIID